MRIEPPPSVPSASAAIPAATAAALPPLEPPGSRAGLRGLRVMPSADWVNPHTASSGIRVLPTTTAPARRSRLTSSSSRRAGAVEVGGRPVARRVPGHRHVVLHRDRDAGERQREPVRPGVHPGGLGEHPLGVEGLEGAELDVPGGDAGQVRAGDLDGCRGPCPHPGGDLAGGRREEVGGVGDGTAGHRVSVPPSRAATWATRRSPQRC